jgi:zona occludens toxin (predicted ATPase)
MSKYQPGALSPHLFHKGAKSMCTKNLLFLIALLLLITATQTYATYTDYIGAGHDDGVTADASSVDEEAVAQNTVNGSGISGSTHSNTWIDT